jgi:soluble lytic murein transglycosylase
VTKSGRASDWSGARRTLLAASTALVCLGLFAAPQAANPPTAWGGQLAGTGAGAELRAGLAALENGEADRAARLFAAVARDRPIVADHAQRLWLKALLALSRHRAAVDLASGFAVAFPDSPLRGEVLELLGDAQDALGDAAAARAAWQQASGEARDADTRAALHLSIAASFERSGNGAEASRFYLAVWRDAPTSEAAGPATEALDRLEERSGRTVRTPREFATRARAFYAVRANREALAAFDRALRGDLSRRARRELQRERAFTLFRLRRYTEAAAAFAEIGDEADARFWRARSLARSGRVEQAIREFERLAKGRFNVLAARSLFLAGMLREEEEDQTRSTASYVRVAAKAPTRGLREVARWRLGWHAYRGQRYREALEHFAALLRTMQDPLERLSARYWRARSLEKLGAAEAADEFRALAIEYPFSYYGWRAAGRVEEGSLARETPERSLPSPTSLDRAKIRRIAILIEAGLLEEARIETRILAALARSLDDRLEVARLATAAGDFHRAERIVVDSYSERLARGPEAGREELWWFAWPAAFADLVTAASKRSGIEPALLSAVMREESGFRPRVLSVVGARGLLQIMPSTGERLAESAGLVDFQEDDLFEPDLNLLLGAHYLGQLLERFDGRASAAIASYNAGPEAVARWIDAFHDEEDDEWVEAIPYKETRRYVKRVLRSQQAYRVLY